MEVKKRQRHDEIMVRMEVQSVKVEVGVRDEENIYIYIEGRYTLNPNLPLLTLFFHLTLSIVG